MLLTLDIGNSNIHIGLFDKKKLLGKKNTPSKSAHPIEEFITTLDLLLTELKTERSALRGCGISSVVPDLSSHIAKWLTGELNISPLVISGTLPLAVKIQYDDPLSLGADRICSAVAAYSKYGGPIIVIDFGTATTYNIISEFGEFMGGVIAPGIKTAGEALYKATAQLPQVTLEIPSQVIGTNTIASIQSGILYAGVDAAEGMIHRLKKLTGQKTIVIATGGFSDLIKSKTTLINHIEKDLVLEGVYLIFEKCAGKLR
ncbi:MAG: type III pantothenate kinase [Bacteroidota bacterium]